MNVNSVHINLEKTPTKITIIPVEPHYSLRTRGNGFCRQTWNKFIRYVERTPNCYVIFPGDMLDVDRPSMRARKAMMYAEPDRKSALEEDDFDHQMGLRNGILKDLKRIKDKILAMVDGDHFRLYSNGTTSTWYMANQLGIPYTYLGERMGWARMIFKRGGRDSCTYTIFVRHGRGGTGKIGADVNKLIAQNVGYEADLFIGGHTHKEWFYKDPILYVGANNKIKEKNIAYARCGSLLRGFILGQTTYSELAEYNPLAIGWPEIYLNITRSSATSNGNLQIESVKGLT